MRLKQVKLNGFKSFSDGADFTFRENGITMVVGPNGCGKSNVVDAIRWALGEQSPKHMRSSNMGDVIFAGSTQRKPLNRAEVTLTFDNSDKTALEKYNEFNEISITRRLYRSGESEYLINNLPSRLMDIRELLMDTGAAGRSYSIVEQGRVDEFITASPLDRRTYMEEAAGVMRYKTKRQAAEKKLEQTRQNLLRVEDVLGELGRQESSLRGQMEAAREFRALKEEENRVQGTLVRRKVDTARNKVRELEETLHTMGQAQEQNNQTLTKQTTRLEELRLEETRMETRLRESRGVAYNKERDIQQTESKLALEKQALETAREWRARLARNQAELHLRLSMLSQEQKARGEEITRLEAELAQRGEALAARESAHSRLEEEAQLRARQVENLQERMLECHTELTGLENQQRFIEERLAGEAQRRGGLEERVAAITTERTRVTETLGAQQGQVEGLEESQTSDRARLEELGEAIPAGEEALASEETTLLETERAVMGLRTRVESLQELEARHEDFGEDVRAFFDWLAEHPAEKDRLGVVGPLADVIAVPGDMVTWAGDYLAPHMETVVVQHAAALPDISGQLNTLGLGGVRFLPLDALPSANGAKSNGAQRLSDALYAGGADPALIDLLFGNVELLPENSPPHPLPDGVTQALGNGREWLSRDGAMHVDGKARVTLGHSKAPGGQMLRRKAEIAELQEQAQSREVTLEAARAKVRALREQVDALREQARSQEAVINERNLMLRELQQEMAHNAREAERLEREHGAISSELEQYAVELERHRAEQEKLAASRAEWEATKARLTTESSTIRMESDEAREAAAASAQDLTSLRVALERLQSQLEAARARVADGAQGMEETNRQAVEAEHNLSEQTGREEKAVGAIEQLTSSIVAGQGELATLRHTVTANREAHEALQAQTKDLEEHIRQERQRGEGTRNRVHETELALTAEKMRLEQFTGQLVDLPEADPALVHLDDKTLESRANSARAKLSRMDGVNLAAPEEYEALESRMTYLQSEGTDLQKAIEDLENSIRRMNMESRKRFRETFDAVNTKFQELFPKVFGGGEARLVLTDSDDPLLAGVDIVAQPPGKKLQSLNLLSGGEKALTAISLIFSFFLIKPSPFCLLDEVDAPLDDVNVTRFNKLIQSMTDHSQFIIITHNKRTMEIADLLYGVTMEEAGVSKLVSVDLSNRA